MCTHYTHKHSSLLRLALSVQTSWLSHLQSAQDKYHEDNEQRLRNRLSSLSNDESQLTSYLKVTWPTPPTFTNNRSLSPTPPILHLPVASRRSASPSSASPAGSRERSPSGGAGRDRSPSADVGRDWSQSAGAGQDRSPAADAGRDRSPAAGAGRDRSPSAGSVPSSPYLIVSSAADLTTSTAVDAVEPDDRSTEDHLQAPSALDSWAASADKSTIGEKQRPVSLYSRRRTVLKAIREKSLSIDVDMQRPPTSNDVIMPRS